MSNENEKKKQFKRESFNNINKLNIQESAKLFANKAYKLRSKKALTALWNNEYAELKKEPYLFKPNTIRTYASNYYRKALAERYKVDFSLHYKDLKHRLENTKKARERQFIWLYSLIKLPYKEKVEISTNYKKKLFKRGEETKEIFNTVEMIEVAKKHLTSDVYSKLALSICFLTGRRPVEILKTAKFKADSKYTIVFTGKAKSKAKSVRKKKYIIPCLVDSSLIVKGLKKLRILRDFSNHTNIELHDTTSKTLHSMVGKLFDFNIKCKCLKCLSNITNKKNTTTICHKLKPKSLRYAYAKICESLFNTNNSTTNYYLSTILLHDEGDVNTANAYQDFVLTESEQKRLKAHFHP